MNKSRLEISVGVFVLIGFVILVWSAVRTGAGVALLGQTYQVEARFTNVAGLRPGSAVLLAGVEVGRIERIKIDHATFTAVISMRISNALKLSTDTIASVRTSGLIGDKFVALSPGSDTTFIAAGGRIVETESAVDLESLISRMAFGSVGSEGGEK